MVNKIQRLFVSGSVLFLLAGIAVARDYEKRVEEQFEVQEGGTLILSSDLGSVDINTSDSRTAEVVVLLTADARSREEADEWFEDFDLIMTQRKDDIEIRGELPGRSWYGRNNRLRVHFDIRVPKNYNLDVQTSGGSVSVADLNGRAEIRTSGGSITIGNVEGQVDARTSGGSIEVEKAVGETIVHTSGGWIRLGNIDGPVDAKTSGGSIEVDSVNGDLEARTSGGGLRLRNISGNIYAKTSGGSINATLLKQIDRPAELTSSGGSITVEVPSNFKADLDASTSGGRVRTDLPISVRGTLNKSSLRGAINGGGERLTLRTSGGNIEIRER